MTDALAYIRDFWNWTTAAAAVVCNGMVNLFFWLIGNPLAPEGRALTLVAILCVLDWMTGTICAILTRTWSFKRLKKGIGKILIWGVILVVSHWLSQPLGYVSSDVAMLFMANWLLIYLVLVDTTSVLEHCACLAIIYEVNLPGLNKFIDIVQGWHGGGKISIMPPLLPATPGSGPIPTELSISALITTAPPAPAVPAAPPAIPPKGPTP